MGLHKEERSRSTASFVFTPGQASPLHPCPDLKVCLQRTPGNAGEDECLQGGFRQHGNYFATLSVRRDRLAGGLLSYKSAIAITPNADSEAWQRIQEIRHRCHAVGLYRWPPHVNLLYPGLSPKDILRSGSESLPRIAAAIATHQPFDVRLLSLSVFTHSQSVMLIMEPETMDIGDGARFWASYSSPMNTCTKISASIEANLPDGIQPGERQFVPHMSVARFQNSDIANPWKKKIAQDLARDPIVFRVEHVRVIVREDNTPFQFLYDIPLLGNQSQVGDYNNIRQHSAQPRYTYPPPSTAFYSEGHPWGEKYPRHGHAQKAKPRACERPLSGRPARRRRPWYL